MEIISLIYSKLLEFQKETIQLQFGINVFLLLYFIKFLYSNTLRKLNIYKKVPVN